MLRSLAFPAGGAFLLLTSFLLWELDMVVGLPSLRIALAFRPTRPAGLPRLSANLCLAIHRSPKSGLRAGRRPLSYPTLENRLVRLASAKLTARPRVYPEAKGYVRPQIFPVLQNSQIVVRGLGIVRVELVAAQGGQMPKHCPNKNLQPEKSRRYRVGHFDPSFSERGDYPFAAGSVH